MTIHPSWPALYVQTGNAFDMTTFQREPASGARTRSR
jgi:hypothetical protein